MGGVNFVLHAAGLARGRPGDRLREVRARRRPARHDGDVRARASTCRENGQALDAIRENAPGQHFLGTAHTLANFETAFYRSTTADNSSFEQWIEDGGLDAAQRANTIWKQRLADYEPPPLDDAIDEELRDFIARRKAELPDSLT